MIGVVAVSLSCVLSLVGLDMRLRQSVGAQTVADAVALAVVNFGAEAAHEVADRNDGVIENKIKTLFPKNTRKACFATKEP